jgi:hypothetical protein
MDVAQYTKGNKDSVVSNFHPDKETELWYLGEIWSQYNLLIC